MKQAIDPTLVQPQTKTFEPRPTVLMRSIGLALCALAVGCAQTGPMVPAPIVNKVDPVMPGTSMGDASAASGVQAESGTPTRNQQGTSQTPQLEAYTTPRAPQGPLRTGADVPPPAPAPNEKADITLSFDQLPLPTFLQVVYGNVLKRNFSVDPAVAARTDLVVLRTPRPQTQTEVLVTVRNLLKSFGIAVIDVGGFYRIVPDNSQAGFSPEIRRGRALPDTPQALRPIFQLVELQAVRPLDVTQWLRTMFGNRVTVTDDNMRGAVLLSGTTDNIQAALEAIQVLDQPVMRGRASARISPAYWSADEMSRRLMEILTSEGYAVGMNPGPTNNPPILLIPLAPINSIVVFTGNEQILGHVLRWARDIDRPNARGGAGFFMYSAKNTDAQDIAKTLNELLSSPAPAGAPAGQQRPRVVVHAATNSIILQGSPDQYSQWLGLLQELDRPARTAMIDVTVAEVSLSGLQNLGVQWQLAQRLNDGKPLNVGSNTGVSVSGAGLNISWGSVANPRVLLNALATDSNTRILSSPKLVARNGEQASFQAGAEVPVITSQQSNANTGAGTGGVLNTIQYRQTGVILRIKPVIHAGGRIDLDITQEVSLPGASGVGGSPTINTRKIETKISLADGSTVMLAGLMSQNDLNESTGIPGLKDVPVAGGLFRNNKDTKSKQELVVLITPYVMNNDMEAQVITDAFRRRLGDWAQTIPVTERNDQGQMVPGTVPSMPRAGQNTRTFDAATSPEDASKRIAIDQLGRGAAAPTAPTTNSGGFERGGSGPSASSGQLRQPDPNYVSPTAVPAAGGAPTVAPTPAPLPPGAIAPPPGVGGGGLVPITDPKLLEEVKRMFEEAGTVRRGVHTPAPQPPAPAPAPGGSRSLELKRPTPTDGKQAPGKVDLIIAPDAKDKDTKDKDGRDSKDKK